MAATGYSIRLLGAPTEAEIAGLCEVLIDCVHDGASVSFMAPLSLERAAAFWRKVAADTVRGARLLLVAEDGEGIAGTVQLVLEQTENQPHRADLAKMLVHRRARGRGIGASTAARGRGCGPSRRQDNAGARFRHRQRRGPSL